MCRALEILHALSMLDASFFVRVYLDKLISCESSCTLWWEVIVEVLRVVT